jgi:hypothetical protein
MRRGRVTQKTVQVQMLARGEVSLFDGHSHKGRLPGRAGGELVSAAERNMKRNGSWKKEGPTAYSAALIGSHPAGHGAMHPAE